MNALDVHSPWERAAYLDKECAGNDQLRRAVDELLRAHERADNPLDQTPPDLQASPGDLLTARTSHYDGTVETPGTVIGPYRLMEQIGQGGFGLVFVADQQQPVRRRVALKIIKPGMESRDVIARFEAERQALAMMDHPNIASVFDAGVTDNGRPYFVMELVRGIPITEFCDHQQLDTSQRLDLFISVCRALQHAHQKGIIHRDLKPSNILVTLLDGQPVPKVIDFGVAKAIGQNLTDKTIYTRFAAMIGTPAYMSPEQAEMSGLDIDTRSDIYSMGVLLYELLTGSTPLDGRRLQSAGLDELRRIIREEDPPRPSTRLTTLGEALPTVSSKRRISPSKLPALVRDDLDWIVMKALDKDRNRRYETAISLATDVRRFLNGEPVTARPPSTWYQFSKFARRHKVTITTTSLVAATMIIGTCISVWLAARAVDERNEKQVALNEAVAARTEADLARREVEKFAERLKQANLLLTSARSHVGAERWFAAHEDYTTATETQPNYYPVWLERGLLYLRLGLWDLAAADYAKAFDLGAPVDGPEWFGAPQLLWYAGDEQRYGKMCTQLLRSESSPQDFPMITVRSCLLAPRADSDAAALASQAESWLAETHSWDRGRRDQRGGPGGFPGMRRPPPPGDAGPNRRPPAPEFGREHGPRPDIMGMAYGVNLYVTGWAHYRAGDFDRAIERLEQSKSQDPRWPANRIGEPLLAMAYYRAGRGEEARTALAMAETTLDGWVAQLSESSAFQLPIPWFDWIEFLTLYREADLLILGYGPPIDPRLRDAHRRALDAIRNEGQAGFTD